MTTVFLLQTHKDPDHLKRLVSLLRRGCPTSKVLVSHDVAASPLPADLFADDPEVYVTSGRGGRGDFLIVDGYLKALAFLRDYGIDYDWLVNMSGSDYPVMSLRAIEAELAKTEFDGFLHHFDVLDNVAECMVPMRWPATEGLDRYYYQYRKLKDSLSQTQRNIVAVPRILSRKYLKSVRIFTAYGLMVGRPATSIPFNAAFRCYAGSYWHAIRRHCAEYLLEFTSQNPDIRSYFEKVLVPDEAYIQTVLVNNRDFRFNCNNRRFFDMSQSRRGHPKLLDASDLPRITEQGYFFARKLERRSGAAVFDALDAIALS